MAHELRELHEIHVEDVFHLIRDWETWGWETSCFSSIHQGENGW